MSEAVRLPALASAASTGSHERQPLLDAKGLEPTTTYGDPEHGSERVNTEQELKPEPTSWWTRIVYALSGLLGTAFMFIVVKGFIESDDMEFYIRRTINAALGAGFCGATAMVPQVFLLMPLRTVMNYQYRNGTSARQAVHALFQDGGLTRYYQGLTIALIQGPISRFSDTAANDGMLALLEGNKYLKDLSPSILTIVGSLVAAGFRIILTPLDTIKTTLQTQGPRGLRTLRGRAKNYDVGALWYGAFSTAAATLVGHYPWFGTNNYLEANLPEGRNTIEINIRRAFIGLVASLVSDTVSNSLRVIKTYRQTNEQEISLTQAVRAIVSTTGITSLFGRGLKTRLMTNGLQGMTFSMLWKFFLDKWNEFMT